MCPPNQEFHLGYRNATRQNNRKTPPQHPPLFRFSRAGEAFVACYAGCEQKERGNPGLQQETICGGGGGQPRALAPGHSRGRSTIGGRRPAAPWPALSGRRGQAEGDLPPPPPKGAGPQIRCPGGGGGTVPQAHTHGPKVGGGWGRSTTQPAAKKSTQLRPKKTLDKNFQPALI